MSPGVVRRGGPGHGEIFRIAWPIILANVAVPLLGLADTAVIGNAGTVAELGAIALGALIFSFVYWGFGFLRMGTTGFTAQAAGAGDEPEVRAALGRSLAIALSVGLGLILFQLPIGRISLALINGSPEVEAVALQYFHVRIWGAPATLATFAIMGTFVGLGRSRQLMAVQLILNALNIILDVLFAGYLGWGAWGIALGTTLSEWAACLLSSWLVLKLLRDRQSDDEPLWPWKRITDLERLKRTLGANGDIMIRTLLLLFGFAWFTDQSARFGDTTLAANHVLLQIVTFTAYFLDGYAFATESLVGSSMGAGDGATLDGAIARSTQLAAASAVILASGTWVLGGVLVDTLTTSIPVRAEARSCLPLATVYILCSFAAFQLDGIFIGATRTRDMRNASIESTLLFLLACWPLVAWAGNQGLWTAFLLFVLIRAVCLGLRYPALRRSVG